MTQARAVETAEQTQTRRDRSRANVAQARAVESQGQSEKRRESSRNRQKAI